MIDHFAGKHTHTREAFQNWQQQQRKMLIAEQVSYNFSHTLLPLHSIISIPRQAERAWEIFLPIPLARSVYACMNNQIMGIGTKKKKKNRKTCSFRKNPLKI